MKFYWAHKLKNIIMESDSNIVVEAIHMKKLINASLDLLNEINELFTRD